MKEAEGETQTSPEGLGGKVGQFLQKSYDKGELAFKHAIGLGASQDVIPISEPSTSGPVRAVEVGWHPVGGLAGKWFAEKTGLGKIITEKINEYPDPTQHWAVLVGDFAHQLWMDENFDVIYTNARIDPKEWRTFQVGGTTFNDEALRRAGQAVIEGIRSKRPGYNLISNNCQTYVLQLLDAIQVSQVKEFGTTQAIYERLLGPGKVADFFVDSDGKLQPNGSAPNPHVVMPSGEQESGVIGASDGYGVQYQGTTATSYDTQNRPPMPPQQSSVLFAQHVMNANTTQLNAQQEMQRGFGEETSKEPTTMSWSKKTNSFLRKFKKDT